MLYDTVKTEYPCEKLKDSHGYFYFFINFAAIFKIYIQYGYHKDCRGGKLLNGERKAG